MKCFTADVRDARLFLNLKDKLFFVRDLTSRLVHPPPTNPG